MLTRILLALSLVLASTASMAFNFIDSQGHPQNLASYHGKWVLVNFWATWCPPCRAEIPDLIALQKQYQNGKLTIIGIAMDYDSPAQVSDFVRQMHINYPIVMGNDAIAAQVGEVQGLPTSYLFNPQGKIVAYQVGPLTQAAVSRYINQHPDKPSAGKASTTVQNGGPQPAAGNRH